MRLQSVQPRRGALWVRQGFAVFLRHPLGFAGLFAAYLFFVFAQVLAEGADFGHGKQVSVFVASDSDRAKKTAGAIAESIGFAVVDAGGLKNARYLEPLAGLNIYLGYGAGLGTSIAPTWIRKT